MSPQDQKRIDDAVAGDTWVWADSVAGAVRKAPKDVAIREAKTLEASASSVASLGNPRAQLCVLDGSFWRQSDDRCVPVGEIRNAQSTSWGDTSPAIPDSWSCFGC